MPFLAVVKKELASVIRDRTIVISILIQLFIASFSSSLLLGMLALYDPDTIASRSSWIQIGVVSSADGNMLGDLIGERGLKVIQFDSLEAARSVFDKGDIIAIVDTPQDVNGIVEVKLYLPDSDAISSLIRMVVQDPLKRYENYLRAQKGIEVHYTDLKGKPSTSYEFVYSILIPMLMFFPAFVSGSMTVDSITEEVESKTLQTLLSAPLSVNGMVGAKIAASVILSFTQCILWLTLLTTNGVEVQNKVWILLLALIVAGITSTAAAICAALLKDRERSQFIYSLVLLAGASISTVLKISPITTLSRLAIGDAYTGVWNVAVFAIFLVVLYVLLTRASRRLLI